MDKTMMGDKPMMEDQSGMENEDSGDYVVEIACHKDGTYTVTGESAQMEAGEGGEMGEPAEGQPAKSIDEALKIARGMMESGMGGDGMSVEQAFSEGFKGDEVDQPVRGRY